MLQNLNSYSFVTQVLKMVKEKEKLAYINPEKSQEEKAKGNDKFKQGNY